MWKMTFLIATWLVLLPSLASAELAPEGKWRRRGDGFQRLRSDGTWVAAEWNGELRPARPGDELDGEFRSVAGSVLAGPDVFTAVNRDIRFLTGRRFRTAGSVVNSRAGSVQGSSARAVTTSGEDGTYRLDRDAIELRHSDGTVERRAFHWGSKRKNMFFMNTTMYYK
jgi:hypothetical protein